MYRRTQAGIALLGGLGLAVAALAPAGASGATTRAVTARPASSHDRGASSGDAASSNNVSTYLYTPGHSGYAAAMTAITTANASKLSEAWTWIPPIPPKGSRLHHGLLSSPTVVDGVIYIGANNGSFYALNETTGAVIWQRFIGYMTSPTCGPAGFAATATVTDAPVTHALTVYVNASNGYLYALDAKTGAVDWKAYVRYSKTADNYFGWASPTIANGLIYIGISSYCAHPEVVGSGIVSFNQATGARVAIYYTEKPGIIGGGVWGSIAVGAPNSTVYAAVGSGPPKNQTQGTAETILALNPKTLKLISKWGITPAPVGDLDFGASPTLFTAVLPGQKTSTLMIGACNKNGQWYALRRTDLAAGTVWRLDVSATVPASENACTSAAAYNGTDLFIPSPAALVDGKKFRGAIREVNPATGAVIWATGLPAAVQGPATMDGAGVIAVPTFDPTTGVSNAVYLLSASTGKILATINNGNSPEFASAVFAGPYLFLATWSSGFFAYKAPAA